MFEKEENAFPPQPDSVDKFIAARKDLRDAEANLKQWEITPEALYPALLLLLVIAIVGSIVYYHTDKGDRFVTEESKKVEVKINSVRGF